MKLITSEQSDVCAICKKSVRNDHFVRGVIVEHGGPVLLHVGCATIKDPVTGKLRLCTQEDFLTAIKMPETSIGFWPTATTKPDWHRGHEWKCENWDFKGGQQAGDGPRRYNCLTCKVVTEWTRESTFRFLGKQPMCPVAKA